MAEADALADNIAVILMRETGDGEAIDQAELLDLAGLDTTQARAALDVLRERGVLREYEEGGYAWAGDGAEEEAPAEVEAVPASNGTATRYEVEMKVLVPFRAPDDAAAKQAAGELAHALELPEGSEIDVLGVLAYAEPRRIT